MVADVRGGFLGVGTFDASPRGIQARVERFFACGVVLLGSGIAAGKFRSQTHSG